MKQLQNKDSLLRNSPIKSLSSSISYDYLKQNSL